MSTEELNEKLQEFLNSDDEVIKDIALQIKILYEGIRTNSISKDQFTELANDLLEAQTIREKSLQLERKIKILQAFNTIRTIIGLIPK